MNQIDENQAFIAAVQWFARVSLAPIKAASPNYKFSIQWGPQSAPFDHGHSFIVNPGSDFVNNWWPRIVQCVRAFRPNHKVRIEGASNIIVDASKFFPLEPVRVASSMPPPPPYDPTKPQPSPYPEPIFCLPCEDKIFTA